MFFYLSKYLDEKYVKSEQQTKEGNEYDKM